MKTVSDAIAKYHGVFPKYFSGDDKVYPNPTNAIAECIKPCDEDDVTFSIGELYQVYVPDFRLDHFRLVCTEKEFNSELTRLHTHGLETAEHASQENPMKYEYGVEYPVSGKMPDLPFDVWVEVNYEKLPPWRMEQVRDALWQSKAYNPIAFRVVDERYKPKSNDTSVSIANLLNAQAFIATARKSSEFSSHNAELADQADAIIQAIIDNLKSERIPAEASYHLSNAQNELSACKSLLSGDKQLADAVFCLSEKLAGIRKGEL